MLKQSATIDRIFKLCKNEFYDPEFEEKLNENRDILGFDNGVYDLKNSCFRDGHPEDYLTFTVGYDYEEYSLDHQYINDL